MTVAAGVAALGELTARLVDFEWSGIRSVCTQEGLQRRIGLSIVCWCLDTAEDLNREPLDAHTARRSCDPESLGQFIGHRQRDRHG